MKNVIVLTSVLLGSTFLVFNTSSPAKVEKAEAPASAKKTLRRYSFNSAPVGNITIVIDKSDYELSVYDEKGWYATYPVVFGDNDLEDKKVAGDKKTPEGSFRINSKRVHEKWYRFMAIDYPTKESWDKFKKRKEKGEIPSSASIGGAIGIHGTWPHEDFVVDKFKNWTLGCICMKRDEVQEIYNFTPIGTRVTIKK